MFGLDSQDTVWIVCSEPSPEPVRSRNFSESVISDQKPFQSLKSESAQNQGDLFS